MSNFQNYLDNAFKNLDINETTELEPVPPMEYDIAKDIGELLASSRRELGLSQKQLSERTGISQANISKIENGRYLPGILILKKLSDALGRRLVIDFVNLEADTEV